MKFFVKLTFTIVLAGLLLTLIDWRQSASVLKNAKILITLLAMFIVFVSLILSSWKWYLLVKSQRISLKFFTLVKCYWIGLFFSNFLPSTVGGDVTRLALLRSYAPSAAIAASIVLERLTGFVILIVFCIISLLLQPELFSIGVILPILWVTVFGISTALIAIVLFYRFILSFFQKHSNSNNKYLALAVTKFLKVAKAINQYRENRSVVIVSLLLSVPFYALIIVFQYLLFVSLDIKISLFDVICVAPIIPLISMLPISLNAIGLAEGAFVLFYMQTGISAEEAFAAAILRRVVTLLLSLIGGLFWIHRSWNEDNIKKNCIQISP